MPTVKQRGKSWYLCWSENGQEFRRSLGAISAAAAREAARLKRDELSRNRLSGVVHLPQGGVPTFSEFSVDYLNWHAREYPASHERVKGIVDNQLAPHFGATALDRISKTQTERFKSGRESKAETIAKELRTLQAMLNRAVFLDIIARNPAKGIKPPRNLDSKPPRWYTADELDAIYANAIPLAGDEAAKGLPPNGAIKDYGPIWRLLANTGMRRTEAMQLKWVDVGKDAIKILSTEGERTKSGKWRQVPLSTGAKAALKELRRMTGRRSHVLPRIHSGSLSRAFGTALDRAKLDGSLHCLRHTFCAHLVMAGVPLRTVQVLAGHASFTTTERYAHLGTDYLSDSVARLKL